MKEITKVMAIEAGDSLAQAGMLYFYLNFTIKLLRLCSHLDRVLG